MRAAKTKENDEGETLGAFSPAEFQRRYGVGNTKFYEEVKAGRLRAVKLGVRTLVLYADAAAWARSLRAAR